MIRDIFLRWSAQATTEELAKAVGHDRLRTLAAALQQAENDREFDLRFGRRDDFPNPQMGEIVKFLDGLAITSQIL